MRKRRPLLQAEVELAISKTQSAKSASRFLGVSYNPFKKYATMYQLDDILSGKYPQYKDWRLKERLIRMGYIEECCHNCGYSEKRLTDNKVPLILEYQDENLSNRKLENLYLLCYNCHFQLIGSLNWKGWRQNIWFEPKQ